MRHVSEAALLLLYLLLLYLLLHFTYYDTYLLDLRALQGQLALDQVRHEDNRPLPPLGLVRGRVRVRVKVRGRGRVWGPSLEAHVAPARRSACAAR